MIDLDWFDEQLEQVLTDDVRALRRTAAAPPPASPAASVRPVAPAPPEEVDPAPPARGWDEGELDLEGHGRRVPELIEAGRMDEAHRHIAAHALLAEESGSPAACRDAAAWATMAALLDGRQDDARDGAELVLALGREARDPGAVDRYWAQRFWVVLEWGDEEERFEALDHCREKAYRHDDPSWRGALTLLLARMGRTEEAGRELDFCTSRCLGGSLRDRVWTDIATNLAESAALLGDPRRAALVQRALLGAPDGFVLGGGGWVCKGSVARFQGMLAAVTCRWTDCDDHFARAVAVHRSLGAPVLLARTLHEWGRSLEQRDPLGASQRLDESVELSRRFELTGFDVTPGTA